MGEGMERRRDSLLREVVHQVAVSPRAQHFTISARHRAADTSSVVFARPSPVRNGRGQFIRLTHALAEQYLAVHIWHAPVGAGRRPLKTTSRLWSYHPASVGRTGPDTLPVAVRAWVETSV
jgi:hypothetical protein